MFYMDAELGAGEGLTLPEGYAQRALYVVQGRVEIGGATFGEGMLPIFDSAVRVEVQASSPSRVVLLGGAVLDGERHIWWNFVSSSSERIERAKADWREGRFAAVPGDSGHSASAASPDISSGRGIMAEDWARQIGLDRRSQ
jgi:redox-sensitive bicupin YhaK (pirin superfamily)